MTRIEPGMPNAVVRNSNQLYVDSRDGELYLGHNVTVTPDVFQQYVEGYRCIACHAVQSQAFPEVCEEVYKDGGGCGFRMRDLQAERLQQEFQGEDILWPDRPVDEERQQWRPSPNSRIWLPGRNG